MPTPTAPQTSEPDMKANSRLIKALQAMPQAHARAIMASMPDLESTPSVKSVSDLSAAFATDMQPVCDAVTQALQAGDVAALRGLKAFLPHLLAEINAEPVLADLLAHQMGKAMLDGLNTKPEELA
jgi:hypothetical protein